GAAASAPPVPAAGGKPETKPARAEAPSKVECRGRVLDPEGKPVAGAQVRLVSSRMSSRGVWESHRSPIARADAGGRFSLTFTPPPEEDERRPRNRFAGTLLASAAGFGPGWVRVSSGEDLADVTVRLVKDDVPLEGRVLDLEGKPIQGVRVEVIRLAAA